MQCGRSTTDGTLTHDPVPILDNNNRPPLGKTTELLLLLVKAACIVLVLNEPQELFCQMSHPDMIHQTIESHCRSCQAVLFILHI